MGAECAGVAPSRRARRPPWNRILRVRKPASPPPGTHRVSSLSASLPSSFSLCLSPESGVPQFLFIHFYLPNRYDPQWILREERRRAAQRPVGIGVQRHKPGSVSGHPPSLAFFSAPRSSEPYEIFIVCFPPPVSSRSAPRRTLDSAAASRPSAKARARRSSPNGFENKYAEVWNFSFNLFARVPQFFGLSAARKVEGI